MNAGSEVLFFTECVHNPQLIKDEHIKLPNQETSLGHLHFIRLNVHTRDGPMWIAATPSSTNSIKPKKQSASKCLERVDRSVQTDLESGGLADAENAANQRICQLLVA